MTEAEVRVIYLLIFIEDRRGPRTREWRQPSETKKGKDTFSPLEPPEGIQPC